MGCGGGQGPSTLSGRGDSPPRRMSVSYVGCVSVRSVPRSSSSVSPRSGSPPAVRSPISRKSPERVSFPPAGHLPTSRSIISLGRGASGFSPVSSIGIWSFLISLSKNPKPFMIPSFFINDKIGGHQDKQGTHGVSSPFHHSA